MDTCEKCKGEMEMYYSPWCPRCDKPQRKTVKMLNLIQCLTHIEATNHAPGYKRRMWALLNDYIPGNDTVMLWPFSDFDELEDIKTEDPPAYSDITLFNLTFDVKEREDLYLEVSW